VKITNYQALNNDQIPMTEIFPSPFPSPPMGRGWGEGAWLFGH